MKSILFCFLFLFLAQGCTRLIIMKEGIKQPDLEDYNSLSNFLLKIKVDTSELLCFKDTIALNKFFKMKIGMPESQFFNSEKKLVDYRESPKDCNGQVSVFLEKAEIVNQKTPVSDEFLEKYLKDLVYVKNQQPFTIGQEKNDLYLVMYWAKYLGKINKRKVFEWLNLVEDARKRGLKIRVLKINADYQQFWGLKKDDLPQFVY